MRDQSKPNVFQPAFLERLDQRDREGYTATEASLAGPWQVRKVADERYAVLRRLDEPEEAEAVFRFLESALIAAAVLPAIGSDCLYTLDGSEDSLGHRLSRMVGEHGLEKAGWLRYFRQELPYALHLLESLLRSPESLAHFLEAASHEVLSHAGSILASRLSLDPS